MLFVVILSVITKKTQPRQGHLFGCNVCFSWFFRVRPLQENEARVWRSCWSAQQSRGRKFLELCLHASCLRVCWLFSFIFRTLACTNHDYLTSSACGCWLLHVTYWGICAAAQFWMCFWLVGCGRPPSLSSMVLCGNFKLPNLGQVQCVDCSNDLILSVPLAHTWSLSLWLCAQS